MKSLMSIFSLLTILSFVSTDLLAQTKLSVQGVIRKSDGNAVDDGLYEITFKLYDTITSGSLLWTEVQPQVKVTSGIYSTILGVVTPLNLPFDQFYFLSLTIDGEELLPRAPLTSAPYANSLIGFDNTFPSSGNVGIGTASPASKLHVEGATALMGNVGIGTLSPSSKLDVIGDIEVSGSKLHVNSNGKVGIGTSNPQSSLDVVNGDIYVRKSGNYRGGIKFMDNNNGYLDRSSAIEGYSSNGGSDVNDLRFFTCYGVRQQRMIIEAEGNVGIGISDPTHRLHVVGTAGLSTGTAWTNTSDIRLKENIQPYKRGLSEILRIKPVYYTYTEASGLKNEEKYGQNIGIIAQEMENIIPEAITTAPLTLKDGTVMQDARQLVKADAIWFAFINAIQEQQIQLEKQQAQILALQAENEQLNKNITAQNANISAKLEELDRYIKKLNSDVSTNE